MWSTIAGPLFVRRWIVSRRAFIPRRRPSLLVSNYSGLLPVADRRPDYLQDSTCLWEQRERVLPPSSEPPHRYQIRKNLTTLSPRLGVSGVLLLKPNPVARPSEASTERKRAL